MRDSDPRDNQPTSVENAEKLEQRAIETEAAATKAEQEALFADHDHAAMDLRIGAMERELERLYLAKNLAARSAETAHDHLQAAEYTFLWGKQEYEVHSSEEALHTHRRWRLMEQAKASRTSRNIEADALRKAVEKMTLEIEKEKDTAPYRAALAKRTREAANTARQRADEARAAADAVASPAAALKVSSAEDPPQP
jgi:hypothetical protein